MILSAVSATREYLRSQGRPSVHLLIRESARAEFAEFPQDAATPDYVVVGDIGAAWNYALLNQVFNELMNGAELIAMHMNKYWQTERGLQMDIGAFVAGLEFVTGKQARIIGKPSQEIFLLATAALGLQPEQVLVIGDDIENDVGGGQAAGLLAALVKTGKYREELARRSEITPDAVLESVAELPALLTE
jgi:HAD superfamily hydrolase (TIGR01458 family)